MFAQVCVNRLATYSRKDGGQRADGEDEQQDFAHREGDVVCDQPGHNRECRKKRKKTGEK